MYKLLIVNNKNTERDVERLQDELLDYFKKTPLNLQVDVVNTDADNIAHKRFGDLSNGKKVYGTENGKDIARTACPAGEYHQVLFYYNLDECKIIGNLTDNAFVTAWSFWNELYIGTEYTEVPGGKTKRNSWERTSATHETMHALVKRVNRSGRAITDHMDVTVVDGVRTPYYKNNDPHAEDGNYARTFAEIEPYWDVVLDTGRMVAAKQKESIQSQLEALQSELEAKKTTKHSTYNGNPEYLGIHHGADARKLTLREMKRIYQDTHHESLYKKYKQPRSRNRDYPDIAYHILVGTDGWEQVRDFDIPSYHISNYKVNMNSVAICISGNYETMTLDLQMERYVQEAVDYVKDKLPSIKHIVPHRNYANKPCPGKNITDTILADWFSDKPVQEVKQTEQVDILKQINALADQLKKKQGAFEKLAQVFRDYPGVLPDYEAAFNKIADRSLNK